MQVELTRVYHFSAAHRLESPVLSAEDNARLYGPCARDHGHNYYLAVTVTGRPDPVTGMVIDLERLDAVVTAEVLAHVDHQALDRVPGLAGVVTTGEGLARAFWQRLAPRLPAGTLARITVVETANNRFEYAGEES
ncbi:MAG TPA: 6-carboxytetrahydropterin synthase [Calidithermus sp.]|jgi:6-pyruvoyltetrahydropterin/6-carboxytetrahydropterin synthase|nr:6-carboxytetrahydropterin synthase [Calidithermus sp.]